MTRRTLALTLLVLGAVVVPAPRAIALAQRTDTASADPRRGPIPKDVAREALAIYNASATVRSLGPYMVDSGAVVEGDVAVVDGPVEVGVAGRVTGRLVAINANVRLAAGARVDGDLLVIGGEVTADDDRTASVGGDVRIYREPLAYVERGDMLVLTDSSGAVPALEELWANWKARERREGVRFTITSAGTYNRVEGLPILAGPEYRSQQRWGGSALRVFGVFRTTDDFRWDSPNLGHDVSGKLSLGVDRGVRLGGELYDLVRPVEDWKLRANEVGLASFVLRRDFRDYYGAHGAAASVAAFMGPDASLTFRLADERWSTREARAPLSLFRNGGNWRANPSADDGRFHVANVVLRLDTRNVVDSPWSGWYLVADYEHGSGRVDSFAQLSPGVRVADDPRVTYGRGFLDLRSYNRLAPDAQLNARLVLAGWLHGDPLPAQRRLSVGGPGSLPGYDFKGVSGDEDRGQCSNVTVPDGTPAQCDRMAILQVEYRGDLHLHDLGRIGDWAGRGWRHGAQWVAFANTGRGWLVERGDPAAGGPARVGRGSLPALDSFRTDLGVGVELGVFGIYVARGISDPGQRTNVFLRLHDRF